MNTPDLFGQYTVHPEAPQPSRVSARAHIPLLARLEFGNRRVRGFTPLQPDAPCLEAGEEGGTLNTKKKLQFLNKVVTGFTIFEAIIILAIITLIAATVLANIPAASRRVSLQHTSQEFALALRRVQNLALAVHQIRDSTGALVVPPAFGIYITTSDPQQYKIFADMRQGGSNDFTYRSSPPAVADVLLETVALPTGITVQQLLYNVDAGGTAIDTLNITFTSPDASVAINGAGGGLPGGISPTARVRFSASILNWTKAVTVRTTGQIIFE